MENFALKQLGQVVYDYCGLNYLANLASLEAKIGSRLRELNSTVWNYIGFLKQTPSEWDVLVELLTINETYFFREDKQLSVYQRFILPDLLQLNRKEPIKVWSAACSSGEEPYSLAMTTLDSGLYSEGSVKIIGTDINKKVLQIALKGLYNKNSLSFRRIPDNWVAAYFNDQGGHYEVKEKVKRLVSFTHKNLLDEQAMKMEANYDVIFCRNVLIYFDTDTVRKVAESFYQSLKPGGYLFLGHAENISAMNLGFETISRDGTFYYRKSE